MKLIALILCLFASRAYSSVAHSAMATPVAVNTQNITVLITTTSGSNRLLTVTEWNTNVLGTGGYNDALTVTANGTNMTFFKRSRAPVAGTLYVSLETWYLPNPSASTAYTVVITLTGAGQQNGGCADEWTGADQTTPLLASAETGSLTSPLSTTITTMNANSAVVCSASWYAGGAGGSAITLDTDYTSYWNKFFAPVGANGMSSSTTTTAAGNYNAYNTWSATGLSTIVQHLYEIAEPQPTATPTITPSATPTATKTITPSNTSTVTPSFTRTVSPTSTQTITPSFTPTRTASPSPSPTRTRTATPRPSATVTCDFSPTRTPRARFTATTTTPTMTPTPRPKVTHGPCCN